MSDGSRGCGCIALIVLSVSAVRHSHSTQGDSFARVDQKSQKISRCNISLLILSFHFSPGRIDKQSRKTSMPVKIWRERIRPKTSRRSRAAYDAKAVSGAFNSANTSTASELEESAVILISGRSLATISPSIETSNLSTTRGVWTTLGTVTSNLSTTHFPFQTKDCDDDSTWRGCSRKYR